MTSQLQDDATAAFARAVREYNDSTTLDPATTTLRVTVDLELHQVLDK